MKKLIVISFVIAALGFGGSVLVNTQHTSATPSPEAIKAENVSSMVDDIAVPLDVILYAQTNYQGSAITQARKITRNGKPHYSLRVDNDTEPSDYTSFYLIYDEKWQLVGEQKQSPPQETKKVEQKRSGPSKEQDQRKPQPATSTQTQSATPSATSTSTTTTSTPTTTQPPSDNSGTGSDGGRGSGTGSGETSSPPPTE
jgi:hypothetical protein